MNALFALPPTADFEDVGDVLGEHVRWDDVRATTETRGAATVTVEVTVAKDYRGDMARAVVATITHNGNAVAGRVFDTY